MVCGTVAAVVSPAVVTSDGRGIPLGKYLLTERLAVGGMGEVYLAIQRGIGGFEKPLALKLLLPHLTEDERAVTMFLDEARVAVRMNHPNIVQIFDVDMKDGRYYLAMELVRGISMSALISTLEKAKVRLPPALVLYIARGLLSGLQHAHEMTDGGRPLHIVHRDVTPHNVLISEAGEVKLTDFGIAKTRDTASRTAPGTIKGKYEYIAPEQAQGDEPDQRADLYSAGISLFHLATLQSPYRRERDVQVIQAVMTEPLPSLAALRPDLPNAFVDMVRRLTSKSARDRPASAQAARELLPPVSAEESAEALGHVVRRYCDKTLSKLEQQTKFAAQMQEATRGIPLDEAERTQENVMPAVDRTAIHTTNSGARRIRKNLPLIFGASLLGSFLAVAAVAVAFKLTDRPAELAAPPREADVVTVIRTDSAPDEARQLPLPTPAADAKVASAQADVADGGETLVRVKAVDAGSVAAVAERSEPAPVRKTPVKVRAPRPPPLGYLYVDAVPWAKVTVSGKSIGETPIAKFPVERGFVNVVLHNPDTRKTVRKRVKVVAGRVAYVKEDLR